MSRAWMPWYIGDYLKDTGHLTTEQHGAYMLLIAHCWQHGSIPASPGERAAIAKLTLKRWKAIGAPVSRFFNDDGTHNRVTKEIARTERAVMQRKQAGKSGGIRSGISRSIKKGQALADDEARSKRDRSGRLSEIEANHEARPQAEMKLPRTNHKEEITTSEFVTAREGPNFNNPAGLLATAHPAGALARPPNAEPGAKPKLPCEVTRAELDEILERKRRAA